MRRTTPVLLLLAIMLGLSACGNAAKNTPAPTTPAPVETTTPVEESTAPADETAAPAETGKPNEEEHAISGIINRMDDYLVLLANDEYQVFDLGQGVSTDGLEEGDEVTVVYTGTLGDEKTPPVAIEIDKS